MNAVLSSGLLQVSKMLQKIKKEYYACLVQIWLMQD